MSRTLIAPDSSVDGRTVTGVTNHDETVRAAQVNILSNLLSGVTFNYIARTLPLSTREVYTYRDGGSGGTVTAVIQVDYTDATLATILSVERTT